MTMSEKPTSPQSLPHRLKRSIILYTGLGIFLTGTIIATVCLYPMYMQLRQFADRELEREAQTHALTIEQYLFRLTDTVQQITSRTRVRDLLVEYNHGAVSREELVDFSLPKLVDALQLADDSVGMTRLDAAGQVAVEVAEAPSWSNTKLVPDDLRKPLLLGPVVTPAGARLLVAAPIEDRSMQRVGTDLVAFSLAGLAKILDELNKSKSAGKVALIMRTGGEFYLFEAELNGESPGQPVPLQSPLGRAVNELAGKQDRTALIVPEDSFSGAQDVTSLVRINDLDWLLHESRGQSVLYAIPNRLISILVPAIAGLVLIGAFGSIMLLTPLAGKMIVQTGEYEAEIRRRTKALNELEIAHGRIDSILRSVPSGLLVCDTDQRVLLVNQAAARLFRLDAGALTGRSMKELVKEGLFPASIDCLDHLPWSQPTNISFALEQEGQSQRFIRAECSLMKGPSGGFLGTVILFQDLTRDYELDRLKNEFISTAAHELRTPLTAILGYSEMLLDSGLEFNLGEEQKTAFLKEIYAKGEALSAMVDDLLDISRIEAGQPLPLQTMACDLLAVVSKVTEQFAMIHRDYRFVTEVLPPPDGCTFSLDSRRIHQVLENLISNAVKYSRSGTQVTISGEPLEDSYQISISDEGFGIAAENIPRVFDKFYRVDSSNTAVSGLGLGLSVARQIINGHHGKISVESIPKQGTKVTFTVPMTC
jgi:signal transduction histidine kinase